MRRRRTRENEGTREKEKERESRRRSASEAAELEAGNGTLNLERLESPIARVRLPGFTLDDCYESPSRVRVSILNVIDIPEREREREAHR